MKYIELFAGVGGFRLGIERAFSFREGRESRQLEILPHITNPERYGQNEQHTACVFANEWDKYAAQTYNKNFGGQIDQRDITTIPTSDIPDHDLLVGGFPCQAFSVAGKRRGFDEARGTLFFEIARILADKKPQHFLLENVKGLLSHNNGSTFQTIIGILADLGYCVEWCVLNSKDFGVPQNRERIIIVGHLGNGCAGQVFPIPSASGKDIETNGEPGQNARTLRSHQGGVDIDDQLIILTGSPHYDRAGQRHVDYSESDTAPTIRATQHKAGDNQPLVAQRQPLRFLDRNQKKIEGDYSFTVDAGQTSGIRLGDRIRRLTPIECERLQGFPDNWTAGVSDTQRYKQMGNAVTVNVIAAVAKQLMAVC